VDKKISDSILEVCDILNKNDVQYLIVGGTAVAFHGYFRWSQNSLGQVAEKFDLDIWYNPTYENYFNLLNALSELKQDVSEFLKEKSPNPLKSYFKFDLDNFTLDFLPKLKSVAKFKNSYKNREVVTLKEVSIPFIGFDELIQDKAANSRPKDILDIKHLKSIKNKK
jgi:hypothetical protein